MILKADEIEFHRLFCGCKLDNYFCSLFVSYLTLFMKQKELLYAPDER